MSNFLRFRGCPSANVLEYAMLPHDKKQLPIAAPHDQSVLYGLKKFPSTPGVAPKEQQERDVLLRLSITRRLRESMQEGTAPLRTALLVTTGRRHAS